jgi:hypothetical protein
MTPLSEIHSLTVQTAKPKSRAYPFGKVAIGFWILDPEGFVWLTTENGTRRLDYSRKVPPGVDPKTIACLLLKQSAGKRNDSFDRNLRYESVQY